MKKTTIIVITVCIITIIFNIIVLCLNQTQVICNIGIETYLGIVATLIGACATIIVGFQIAHFIEMRNLKEQIDELNKLRANLIQRSAVVERNLAFVKNVISSAFRVFYKKFKDDTFTPVACIFAIMAYDTTDKEQASTTLLSNYRKLYEMLSEPGFNTRFARRYLDNLKELTFPIELKDYYEICRLHYNVINLLENKNNSLVSF